MDEDDYTIEPVPACPTQGIDVVILVLDSVRGFSSVVTSFWEDVTRMAMAHANFKVEKKRFAREAGLEIERLVSDE